MGELQDRITLERVGDGIQLSDSDARTLRGFAAGDAIVRVVDRNNRPVWPERPGG